MKYSKIELFIATAFFILFSYVALLRGFSSHGDDFSRGMTGLTYFINYVMPNMALVVATYGAFLILNYVVFPKFWVTKKHFEAVGLTVVVFVITGLIFVVAQSYLRSWYYNYYGNSYVANLRLFSRGFSMAALFLMCYVIYVVCREAIIYQYNQYLREQRLASRIMREVMMVLSIWILIILPFTVLQHTALVSTFGPFYVFGLPYCFTLYFLNIYLLIPIYKKAGPSGWAKYLLSLLLTIAVSGIIEMSFLLQTHQFSFMGYVVFEWFIPTLIVLGVSWIVYWANADRYQQLASLKTALGTSNANLQFLRSQINPHFLFNALNTLYGTALMEKADKTGEGIQKLGDMMRFMLHENNQDKIALSREIDYLHNYIDLQNMRLALSPDIVIDVQIEDIGGYYEIAPMLLIPFIENAYKHGISLQARSWIDVSLYKRDNILHLDVRNSTHPVNENDPERYHSGTGLDNVKQRLQLLYPKRHELIVRQNAKEFFIHLSITLTAQAV